jgi:hypothetical protein
MAVIYCESFGLELLQGTHNFASHTFKLALFTSSATLDEDTTTYSATNEITATGYSAGGTALSLTSGYPQIVSGRPAVRFDSVSFTLTTEEAAGRYGLIYNSSASNKAVLVIDFNTRALFGTVTFNFPLANEPIISLTMGH